MSISSKHLLFPLLLVFYEIATYLSNDMYLPALPQMMSELNLSSKEAQLTLTTWFLGQASMPFFVGVISERYGRRPVLLWGGLIYILGTILCAMAPNTLTLLIGRFLEGGMVAAMLVPGYATIHELYEKNEAIKILALMGSIVVLAPALGPLFGGLVLYVTDWRGIFWVIFFLACIALLALYKVMPETLPSEKRVPVNVNVLVKQYWNVITNKRFMLFMAILGLIFGGWISWISAGSLLIIETFHYSAVAFGIFQALIFAAFILGARTVKYLLETRDANAIINFGLIITLSGGFLILLMAFLFPDHLYPFLFALAIYSFGSALCFSPLNRVIIETSNEPMGVRVALFTVFLTAFAALGSAMASLFFTGTVPSLAYLIAGAIIIAWILKLAASFEKSFFPIFFQTHTPKAKHDKSDNHETHA